MNSRCSSAAAAAVAGSTWSSTSSRGDAYDNALCESFFATLECELLDRQVFTSRSVARMAIFDFLEGWYNAHRRNSGLGQRSPADFEREWEAVQVQSA